MDRESLIALLAQYGLSPSTDTLDQHFIACKEAVKKVADAAGLLATDHVLEIGPGPGQLTREVLSRGAYVTAIELDTRFQPLLEDLQAQSNGRLNLIWGSALTEPWPFEANKMVMNPPYSILEALLERIHENQELQSVSMIIGKKYYVNTTAKIGDHEFTKSALMTQARFEPSLVSELDKKCFYPEAGGKSVIMHLALKKKPHPVLYRLADFFVSDPMRNAGFVIQQALEPLNKRARKYKSFDDMITVKKLGLRPDILNKRLQDLSNYEIQQIVAKLGFFYNAKFAKGKKLKNSSESEDSDLED